MKQIPFLHQGSKIGIVAPARKVTPEEMQYAINWLKEQGFVPVYDDRLFAEHHIFAGDDDFRAAVFQEYLDNEQIEAIWLARGGYGHASMPFFFANKTPEAKQSLLDALLGKPLHYVFPSHKMNRVGQMEGEIIGGNLSILYGMIGSDTFPELEGKILFIEEVDEYIYHIDRMMHALKRAGKLARLKGLIIGGLTQIHDNSDPFGMSVEEVIAEAVAEYDYPVCFGFPAGHFNDNRALFFGLDSRLLVTDEKVVFLNDDLHSSKSIQ